MDLSLKIPDLSLFVHCRPRTAAALGNVGTKLEVEMTLKFISQTSILKTRKEQKSSVTCPCWYILFGTRVPLLFSGVILGPGWSE